MFSSRTIRVLVCLFGSAFAAGAGAGEWPCYRADAARSGVTREKLSLPLSVRWEYRPAQGPKPAWPEPGRLLNRSDFDYAFQPVAAGGRVHLASSADDTVRALDGATGRELWSFTTGGPVRLAPHLADGKCYFASDDGWAYCLEAGTGKPVWRFRAAPKDRRMIGNGRMISRWPCRSGVLVVEGVAYVTSGMWPALGVFVWALDAATGKVLWCNDTSCARFMAQPHVGAYALSGVAPQGYLLASQSALVVPTGRAAPAGYDRSTGRLRHYYHAENKLNGSSWATLVGRTVLFRAGFQGPDGPPTPGEAQPTEADGITAAEDATGYPGVHMAGTYLALAGDRLFYAVGPGEIQAVDMARWRAWQAETAETVRRAVEASPEGRAPSRFTRPRLDADAVRWSVEHGRAYCLAEAGGVLFVGGSGAVTALDETGRQVWRAKVNGQVRGLAVADGRLLAATGTGRIYSFAPAAEVGTATVVTGAPEGGRAAPKPTAAAAELAATLKWTRGYALLLGLPDAALAEEIARATGLRVIAVLADEEKVAAERRRLVRTTSLYGSRIVVHHRPRGARLPYPPYFANAVVVGGKPGVPGPELYRVLRPCGGVLCLTGLAGAEAAALARATGAPDSELRLAGRPVTIVRGRLPGAHDWNCQAGLDRRVKWPLTMLWFGEPGPSIFTSRHLGPAAPVPADGIAYFRGYDHLVAVDAYNGTELWRREIPSLHTGRRPATADPRDVYGDDRSVYVKLATGLVDLRKLLKAGKLLALDWPTSWRVFGPLPAEAGVPEAKQLAAIPQRLSVGGKELAGAKAEAPRGVLDLAALCGGFEERREAWAFAAVDCAKAGRLIVNASADWWMAWYVDGKCVYDTLADGNMASPMVVAAHGFAVDVAAGRHVLAVLVQSGSRGFLLNSFGAMALPAFDPLAAGPCVELDRWTGEQKKVYGRVRRSKRLALDKPLACAVKFEGEDEPDAPDVSGTVTLSKTGSAVVMKLATGKAPPAGAASSADAEELEALIAQKIRAGRPPRPPLRRRAVWDLYLDFRPEARRLGLFDRGVFVLRVAGPGLAGPLGTRRVVGSAHVEPSAAAKVVDEKTGDTEIELTFDFEAIRDLAGAVPASLGFAAKLALLEDHLPTGRPMRPRRAAPQGIRGTVFEPSDFTTDGWATLVLRPGEPAPDLAKARAALVGEWDDLPDYVKEPPRAPARPRDFTISRRHPLTGAARRYDAYNLRDMYQRFYGCGGTGSGQAMDFFRSGTVALYDYDDDSGLRNFGGIKPGCHVNLIAALGLLISSAGTAGCGCGYNFQGSFALVPTDERSNEDWAVFWDLPAEILHHAALNLGAPGDRRDAGRTLWLALPRPAAGKTTAGIKLPCEIEADESGGSYRRNADRLRIAGTDRPWVYASGISGLRRIAIQTREILSMRSLVSKDPPKVDGRLDEACWEDTAPVAVRPAGTVWLRHDAANLYVGYRRAGAEDPLGAPRAWTADRKGRDSAVWTDDFFEVCLGGRFGSEKELRLAVSASGARYDAMRTNPPPGSRGARRGEAAEEKSWDGEWTAAVRAADEALTMEVAVPWKTLAGAGLAKGQLGLAFRGGGPTEELPRRRFAPVLLDYQVAGQDPRSRLFTVRLHFAEPDDVPAGQRVFHVAVQGRQVLRDFDVVKEAGAPRRAVVREFGGISVLDALEITLTPVKGEPLLCGVELAVEGP